MIYLFLTFINLHHDRKGRQFTICLFHGKTRDNPMRKGVFPGKKSSYIIRGHKWFVEL